MDNHCPTSMFPSWNLHFQWPKVVFRLDFQKMISKKELFTMGLGGKALDIIADYLTDRK